MPFAVMLMIFALAFWWGGRKHRQRRLEQTRREVEATRTTGLPSPDTALGQKARAVQNAEDDVLKTPPPVHGSARWATEADVESLIAPGAPQYGTRDLWLGTLVQTLADDERDTAIPLVVRYPGHILTVAGTGQGKSVTQLVANLLTYGGSTIVLDPKGELYDLTAATRRHYGPVYRLAPYTDPGFPSDRYNPLAEMMDNPRELGARARRLAEMLIVRDSDKGASNAAFWENQGINLLTALIMSAVETATKIGRPETATLAEVMRLATLPILGATKRNPKLREYIEDQLLLMAETSRITYVQQQARAFLGLDPKTLGGFLAEINANLAFFSGHPGFAEVTSASDFRFADLMVRPTTVYLTIAFKEMATSFRFLRAMVGMAFAALEEQRDAKDASVLFVLDEFAALRDMAFMRDAVAQMRSSGAWLWFLVQDLTQLQVQYGDAANVFLSQTDHQIYFGATLDQPTKKHLSTALGVGTYAYRDPSLSWSHSVGTSDGATEAPTQLGGLNTGRNVGQSVNVSDPVRLVPKPLLTPAEVGTYLSLRRLGDSHARTTIILSKQAGGYPIKARRHHWLTVKTFHEPATTTVAPLRPARTTGSARGGV
jgi:type IV secretion system protein VirD4